MAEVVSHTHHWKTLPSNRGWSVQAPYPPLLGVLTMVTLKFSTQLGFHFIPQMFPSSSCFSQYSFPLSFSPQPDTSYSHLDPSTLHTEKSILFSFPRDIHVVLLEPSLLLSLFGSLGCSMIFFYFTANIHS